MLGFGIFLLIAFTKGLFGEISRPNCSVTGKNFQVYRALNDYLAENAIHDVNVPPIRSLDYPTVNPLIQFTLSSLKSIDEVENSISRKRFYLSDNKRYLNMMFLFFCFYQLLVVCTLIGMSNLLDSLGTLRNFADLNLLSFPRPNLTFGLPKLM